MKAEFENILTPSDRLMQCAMNASDYTEIVQMASDYLQASVILADALHYILACSKDVRFSLSENPNWFDLIQAGIVPPVRGTEESPSDPRHNLREHTTDFSDDLRFHEELETSSKKLCSMCDIKLNGLTVLKLAVTTEVPLTAEQKKLALRLAMLLQISYSRFQEGRSCDPQSQYLLDILYPKGPLSMENLACDFFEPHGNYRLYCFDTKNLRGFNLSFIPIAAKILSSHYAVSALDDKTFILLVNSEHDISDIYQELKALSEKASFPIIESREIFDIDMLTGIYPLLRIAAETATEFHGSNGIYQVEDFSLFLLFERIIRYSPNESIIHPDAVALMDYDRTKNAELAKTIYCYLYHNREAVATADALFIHRNTLDKRLKKAETLIQATWHDVSYQVVMLASLYELLKESDALTFYNPS